VHGMISDSNVQAHTTHRHVQAFQSSDGVFEPEYNGFGITLPEERPRDRYPVPPAGRSVLRWDADLDGRLDIIINYHLGPPETYTLDELPTRCTIRPRPTTVMSMNAGFAHDRGDGIWRSWDHGGQHRASPPSTLVVPGDVVRFRFPSGAIVPVRCSEGTLQEVVEPSWVERDADGSMIRIDAAGAGLETISSVRALWRDGTESGLVELLPTDGGLGWALPVGLASAEVMIEIDGRWLWRWLQ
jgi:hypothetical protein